MRNLAPKFTRILGFQGSAHFGPEEGYLLVKLPASSFTSTFEAQSFGSWEPDSLSEYPQLPVYPFLISLFPTGSLKDVMQARRRSW